MDSIQYQLIRSFGASILQKHLAALRLEIPGVRSAEDIESIHRMRVASRRLRAALPLFADCFSKKQVALWTKEIKGITQALGAARDADVQLDLLKKIDAQVEPRFHPGLRRLILRLSQQRQRLQKDVENALDRLDRDGFYAGLGSALAAAGPQPEPGTPFPHALFERSSSALTKRLEDFLSFEPFVLHPECVAELHAMRISAKQLRYTLETFSPLYPGELQPYLQAVKSVQESLGNIHDCDVWLVFLPEFCEEELRRTVEYYGHPNPFRPFAPGLAFFEADRRQERESQYHDFVRRWGTWENNNLWASLRAAISAPIYLDVFPLAPERPDLPG